MDSPAPPPPAASAPAPEITDVQAGTNAYVRAHYRVATVICNTIGVLIIAPALLWAFIGDPGHFTTRFFEGLPVIFSAVFVMAIPTILARQRVLPAFYATMATVHGFQYEERLSSAEAEALKRSSTFFSAFGIPVRFDHQYAGVFQDLPFRYLSATFTVQEGKSSRSVPFRFAALDLGRALPTLTLIGQDYATYGARLHAPSGTMKQELEGDFDDSFALYAAPGLEVPAREFMAPDRMAALLDNFKGWSAQTDGTMLYVLGPGVLGENETDFNRNLAETQALLALLFHPAQELADG